MCRPGSVEKAKICRTKSGRLVFMSRAIEHCVPLTDRFGRVGANAERLHSRKMSGPRKVRGVRRQLPHARHARLCLECGSIMNARARCDRTEGSARHRLSSAEGGRLSARSMSSVSFSSRPVLDPFDRRASCHPLSCIPQRPYKPPLGAQDMMKDGITDVIEELAVSWLQSTIDCVVVKKIRGKS